MFPSLWLLVIDEGSGAEAACEPSLYEIIPAELCDALKEVSSSNYVDVDSNLMVCSTLADEDIIVQAGEEPVVMKIARTKAKVDKCSPLLNK